MRAMDYATGVLAIVVLCVLSVGAQTPAQNAPASSPQSTAPQNTSPGTSPSATQTSASQNATTPQPNAANSKAAGFSDLDRQFIQKAAQDGQAEIQLGQLAAQKASSDDVKKLAQRMIDDHTKANGQLQQVASSAGVQLSQQPGPAIDNLKMQLSAASVQAFDQLYLGILLRDHDSSVAEFSRETQVGQNSGLKDFANATIPVLQDHLKSIGVSMTAQSGPGAAAQSQQPSSTKP